MDPWIKTYDSKSRGQEEAGCLSGRAYIGEVLIQIWLKSMQK